jgi:HAL2 family 3'(2'),5'-bisphosphate nucleotidase
MGFSAPDPAGRDLLGDPVVRAAVGAVRAAMDVCRAVRQHEHEVRALTKDDRSPVTVADFASQAVVAYRLAVALGEVRLVAEEEAGVLDGAGQAGYLEAVLRAVRPVWADAEPAGVIGAIASGNGCPDAAGFWTLDPIDGTKGFLRGQQYAVSLAYIRGGRPVLGVLGCPNLSPDRRISPETTDSRGLLCVAAEGQGAFAIETEETSDATAPAPVRLAAVEGRPGEGPGAGFRACLSVEKSHSDGSVVDAILRGVGLQPQVLRMDSQCKYAVVARGQAEAYVRAARAGYAEWIWDHAAGALMAAEAGCRVTDLGGRPLDFGVGRRLAANRGVLCARPDLHRRLLDAAHRAGVAGRVGPTAPA